MPALSDYHTWPKRCPIYHWDTEPWPSNGYTIGFIAQVTAPQNASHTLIDTEIRNVYYDLVGHEQFRLEPTGSWLSGTVNTQYQSGTIKPAFGQFINDVAQNYVDQTESHADV
jgi:hypothetical protein